MGEDDGGAAALSGSEARCCPGEVIGKCPRELCSSAMRPWWAPSATPAKLWERRNRPSRVGCAFRRRRSRADRDHAVVVEVCRQAEDPVTQPLDGAVGEVALHQVGAVGHEVDGGAVAEAVAFAEAAARRSWDMAARIFLRWARCGRAGRCLAQWFSSLSRRLSMSTDSDSRPAGTASKVWASHALTEAAGPSRQAYPSADSSSMLKQRFR